MNYYKKYLKYKKKYLELKGGAKDCTIEELMNSLDDKLKDCNNLTRVQGSCSEPHFFKSNEDISMEIKEKWIKLLNLLENKIKLDKDIKNLDFILGATTNFTSDFENNITNEKRDVQIYFDPINKNKYIEFGNIYKIIEEKDKIINEKFNILMEFPLSHNFPNSLEVLNKIISLKEIVNIRITNRICGSCFRSLYYLKKNGINYIVNPEQKLSDILDSREIRECFELEYIDDKKLEETIEMNKEIFLKNNTMDEAKNNIKKILKPNFRKKLNIQTIDDIIKFYKDV